MVGNYTPTHLQHMAYKMVHFVLVSIQNEIEYLSLLGKRISFLANGQYLQCALVMKIKVWDHSVV